MTLLDEDQVKSIDGSEVHFNTDEFRDDSAKARRAVAQALPQLANQMEKGEYVGGFNVEIELDGQSHELYGDVDER